MFKCETLKDIQEYMHFTSCDEAGIFTNPPYARAFMGVSSDNRAVYSQALMIKYHMEHDGLSKDEAAEYVQYNTLSALTGADDEPIVAMDLDLVDYLGTFHPLLPDMDPEA